MKKVFTVFSVMFVVGCTTTVTEYSSPSSQTFEKNECVTAGAAYEFSYREKSGNCGAITSQVIIVPEDGILTIEGCTSGPSKYEGCSVYVDTTCKQGNLTTKQTGKMNWSEDGSYGSGIFTITGSTSNQTCMSTYDVRAVRL